MESLSFLVDGFAAILNWQSLAFCLLGVVFGQFVGILPGLGPAAGTALLLPLTYAMGPTNAIIMLAGIYYGAMYGGTITSVLLNMPGEAASVITCLDGYPMAKQGRAGAALGISALGSFIGGVFALAVLIFIGPFISRQALRFGPPEYFALLMMGMSLVIALMGKSLLKGIIASLIGLSLTLIGQDPGSGYIRFTFGNDYLMTGFELVTLAMGLFGLSEILENAEEGMRKKRADQAKIESLLPNKDEWGVSLKAIGRGSVLGSVLGLVPGLNSIIPTILSYSIEKRVSKHPEKFGKGAIEGVAGPETANNAYSGAALIPLFTLGIPTSPTIAILFGAFIMHGLTPGPMLYRLQPQLVWGIIASMLVGNLILLLLNWPLAGFWAKITKISNRVLLPVILIVSVIGTYSLRNSLFDVGSMLGFGIAGYFLKKAEIPLAPIILTFVLGDLLEKTLQQTLTMFQGNLGMIFTRPISATIMAIAIIVFAFSVVSAARGKRKGVGDTDM